MTSQLRKIRAFLTYAVALARDARNPLSVVPLLLLRGSQWRTRFRVGQFVLSARRADITAISEFIQQEEYAFITALTFPPDALILDLGANIGCFAALMFSTSSQAEVHSVEPSPDTFAVLEDNRQRYPNFRWHVHRLAIAATNGRLTFSEGGPSTARRLTNGQGVSVEAESFDAFVSRVAGDRSIFVCKMDIEGAEVPIFAAAPHPALHRIQHVIVEIHGGSEARDVVVGALLSAFPHLEAIASRTSSKPLIHAWRS